MLLSNTDLHMLFNPVFTYNLTTLLWWEATECLNYQSHLLSHSFSWSSERTCWTFSLNVTFTKTVGFKLSWRLSVRKQWQVARENMEVVRVCGGGVYVTAGMWRRSEVNYCEPSAGDWVGVCSAKCVCRHGEASTCMCSRERALVDMLCTHVCVC